VRELTVGCCSVGSNIKCLAEILCATCIVINLIM
jgi:hypothetical protein